ncbi:MAG TPA: porin family protein [Puia sp.]|nr:porin family protein [Puia sp.]
MKTKSVFISVMLIAVMGIGANAQGFHVGLKGGANLFKIDGRSFNDEYNFSYNVGAFAELYFTKNWGIQPELLWNQTNFRTSQNFNDIVPNGFNDLKGSLNYLTMPILLSYRPAKIISLQFGPQFGILVNQTAIVDSAKAAFRHGDFSLVGGAQLNLGGFKLGARYFIGLNNIGDVTTVEAWKNQGAQVYVGFRIL